MAGLIYIFRYFVLDCVVAMGNAKSDIDKTRIGLIRTRHIIGFFCIFVLIYVPLIIPWLGLASSYSKLYSAGAAFLFKPLVPEGSIRFDSTSNAENDIRITFYNLNLIRPDGKAFFTHGNISSFYGGYIYIAFMAALVIATPISLKRRLWALFIGIILIHGFIFFKLAIWIIYGFNREPLSLLVLSPFWKQILLLTIEVVASNVTFGFIVCVFVWLLVSFRREDWVKILPRRNEAPCLS
jgi:hypothetical protein